MTITAKSTKPEILAAYRELVARPVTTAMVGQWAVSTAQTVVEESVLLVKDCYNLAKWARRMYDGVVAELSRPLLKKI